MCVTFYIKFGNVVVLGTNVMLSPIVEIYKYDNEIKYGMRISIADEGFIISRTIHP